MPIYKSNSILSEISVFFKKDDSNSALFTLTDMLKGFNMSEKVLFGSRSKCNSKYSLLQVLELLIMFPCFMIKNPYNYCRPSLSGFFGCEKDVFYRFVNNEIYDWRKILYRKHSVMPVFDSMIFWSTKVDFQKPPKHSELMWNFQEFLLE
jgi:hypothetical protein